MQDNFKEIYTIKINDEQPELFKLYTDTRCKISFLEGGLKEIKTLIINSLKQRDRKLHNLPDVGQDDKIQTYLDVSIRGDRIVNNKNVTEEGNKALNIIKYFEAVQTLEQYNHKYKLFNEKLKELNKKEKEYSDEIINEFGYLLLSDTI